MYVRNYEKNTRESVYNKIIKPNLLSVLGFIFFFQAVKRHVRLYMCVCVCVYARNKVDYFLRATFPHFPCFALADALSHARVCLAWRHFSRTVDKSLDRTRAVSLL